MITAETRKNAENLLYQERHYKGCRCMPCRLLRHLFMDSEERIDGCRFEDCANVTLFPPGAELRLCADHRCPDHSSYEEQDFTPRGVCPPPCTHNCGCNCETCREAREERIMLGHREDCGCTDCGCMGDYHGDCGIRCQEQAESLNEGASRP